MIPPNRSLRESIPPRRLAFLVNTSTSPDGFPRQSWSSQCTRTSGNYNLFTLSELKHEMNIRSSCGFPIIDHISINCKTKYPPTWAIAVITDNNRMSKGRSYRRDRRSNTIIGKQKHNRPCRWIILPGIATVSVGINLNRATDYVSGKDGFREKSKTKIICQHANRRKQTKGPCFGRQSKLCKTTGEQKLGVENGSNHKNFRDKI